jgi:hypothetical protein
VQEYRGDLGVALTDVVGMDAFLADFDLYFAKLFDNRELDGMDTQPRIPHAMDIRRQEGQSRLKNRHASRVSNHIRSTSREGSAHAAFGPRRVNGSYFPQHIARSVIGNVARNS